MNICINLHKYAIPHLIICERGFHLILCILHKHKIIADSAQESAIAVLLTFFSEKSRYLRLSCTAKQPSVRYSVPLISTTHIASTGTFV